MTKAATPTITINDMKTAVYAAALVIYIRAHGYDVHAVEITDESDIFINAPDFSDVEDRLYLSTHDTVMTIVGYCFVGAHAVAKIFDTPINADKKMDAGLYELSQYYRDEKVRYALYSEAISRTEMILTLYDKAIKNLALRIAESRKISGTSISLRMPECTEDYVNEWDAAMTAAIAQGTE